MNNQDQLDIFKAFIERENRHGSKIKAIYPINDKDTLLGFKVIIEILDIFGFRCISPKYTILSIDRDVNQDICVVIHLLKGKALK